MKKIIIRLMASLLFMPVTTLYAQTNLQELIDAPEVQAASLNSSKNARTTSPETMALLEKLLLEENASQPSPQKRAIDLPAPIPAPSQLLHPDNNEAPVTCDIQSEMTVRHFEQALALAICKNEEIRLLAYNLHRYLYDYKISQSAWMPEINFISTLSSETDKYSIKNNRKVETTDRSVNYGLELSWLLFDFGKREALINQKENIWLSNQYQTLSSFQDFIIQFAQTYYQVIANRTILNAAKESESLARKTWDITQNKYRSGVGVLGDALQAENVLLSATQYRMQKEGEYDQSLGKLATALNLPVTTRLAPEDRLDIPSDAQIISLKPLLDQASVKHPLVLAAQKNIQAAEQQVKQAERDFMPSVSVQANMNRETSSLEKSQPYNPVNRTDKMYVGLNISVPLFSGFRSYNQLQAANVQLSYSQQDYHKVVKEVGLNTWNAWQGLNTANRNFELISQRLKTARRAYDIANGRYLTGVGTIIELLNTQQQLSNAEIDEASIKMDWFLQRLSLMASVGKLTLY
ncbi:TolC family protein [Atlantibacter hermannii]|uniref:TolC family protein n=1 Tax=Atlantibacter hermannii TaxID=565 RepID=UPI0028AD7262|nr:TolC family protein [Atlantibacter hermannii]